MNLPYTCLLLAAAEHGHGFVKLRGTRADAEVRLMATAGLIDGTYKDSTAASCTSITRILGPGQAFLKAFKGLDTSDSKDKIPPATAASRAAMVRKWSANFGSGMFLFKEQMAVAELARRVLASNQADLKARPAPLLCQVRPGFPTPKPQQQPPASYAAEGQS